ncbi:hypothetical protein XE98_000150 [Salmonella enterica subsp. enterica]|nr:hypothetical protein [Salmonella enterica subsp. enterica]
MIVSFSRAIRLPGIELSPNIKVHLFYTLSPLSTITAYRHHHANKNYFHLFIPCAI